MKKQQTNLFDELEVKESWREHWENMPSYTSNDKMPNHKIIVSFETFEDVKKFAEILNQKITPATKGIWFPKKEIKKVNHLRYSKK